MPAFLLDLVVVLGAALVVLLASRLVRLPPVLGFMLTGMLIGPYGMALVSDPHQVETIADSRHAAALRHRARVLDRETQGVRPGVRRRGAAPGRAHDGRVYLLLVGPLGAPRAAGACLVSLSSTAMVFRLIADRAEFATPQGRS